jgi:hypothetical protein
MVGKLNKLIIKKQNMNCATGQILRKAYTTRKGTKVAPKCIKDRGLPGKGPKILPIPKKGKLARFGYKGVKKMTLKERRLALIRASMFYGPESVAKMLVLVANFNRRVNPRVAAIFEADARWIRNVAKKAPKAQRKAPRREP